MSKLQQVKLFTWENGRLSLKAEDNTRTYWRDVNIVAFSEERARVIAVKTYGEKLRPSAFDLEPIVSTGRWVSRAIEIVFDEI